jgi:hypothetical protein
MTSSDFAGQRPAVIAFHSKRTKCHRIIILFPPFLLQQQQQLDNKNLAQPGYQVHHPQQPTQTAPHNGQPPRQPQSTSSSTAEEAHESQADADKPQLHSYTLIPRVLYLRRAGMRFSLGFGRSGRVSYG